MKNFILVLITILISSNLYAQKVDKSFGYWRVYSTTLQNKKTCYIGSRPVKKSGNYKYRDDPYFLVTSISKNINEINTSSGYKYKKKSLVTANIDGKNFSLFTDDEYAWAKDESQDNKIIESLKKGNLMTIKGTSIKGTYSIDRYNLNGFTKAFNRMKEICKN